MCKKEMHEMVRINEKIHWSVIERLGRDAIVDESISKAYAPDNLPSEWKSPRWREEDRPIVEMPASSHDSEDVEMLPNSANGHNAPSASDAQRRAYAHAAEPSVQSGHGRPFQRGPRSFCPNTARTGCATLWLPFESRVTSATIEAISAIAGSTLSSRVATKNLRVASGGAAIGACKMPASTSAATK